MNLVLLYDTDFIDTEKKQVSIHGRRLEHVLSVIGAEKGKELKVGLVNGMMGTATIKGINKSELLMEVSLVQAPPEPLPLTLILALPRPKTFRKAIEASVSLGIKKIYVIESWRVEKSYWSSPVLEPENLLHYITNGLEQARDTIMPEIIIRKRLKPFVEDEIPSIIKDTVPLIAHPYTNALCPHNIGKPVTLAIGPEGGFIPYEVELFQKQGFLPVKFGERVIRVEYALPVVVGRLF